MPFHPTDYFKNNIALGNILEVSTYRSQDQDNDDFTGYNSTSTKYYFEEMFEVVAYKNQLTEQKISY